MKTKKLGAAVLTPDKTDFKTKAMTRNTEGPRSFISRYLSEETQIEKAYAPIHSLQQPKCPSRDE